MDSGRDALRALGQGRWLLAAKTSGRPKAALDCR